MIHLRVVCLEQTFDLTPSNTSSLGRVDANITLRSLVRHFFSCHTLIIQFRRRKCKAEMRLFLIQTQFFYCWGVFFNQIGRGCAVSNPRPYCIIVSIAITVRSPILGGSPLHLYQWMDKRRAKHKSLPSCRCSAK